MPDPADRVPHLAEICAVRSGFTARGALMPEPDGILTIQQGDLSSDGAFTPRSRTRIRFQGPSFLHYASPGDVIFRSRGPHWSAWEVPELDEPLFAVAPLFILRPTSDTLDPSYLRWFLMQSAAQRYFATEAKGTAIQMITKSVLGALPVTLPPVQTQRVVGRAALLAEQERALVVRLAALHHRRHTAQLTDIVQQRKNS